jgi:probable DNA repair protein
LRLLNIEIPYSLISRVLCSPFIGEAEIELYQRANIDEACRKQLGFHTSLTQFVQTLPQLLVTAPKLQERLHGLLQLQAHTAEKRTPSRWLSYLNDIIQTVGWPGERVIDSLEYQLLTQWQAVLSEIAATDTLLGEITFKAFYMLLHETSSHHVFQAKTAEAPVQVLGLLEAAGSVFDCIWIAGLTDQTWPPPAKPNPFIPITLQHRYAMPHANSERQSIYCERLMTRFLHSASSVYFSYAQWDADHELAPSPLLSPYSMSTPDTTKMEWTLLHKIARSTTLEAIKEPLTFPLTAEERKSVYSASLLEQQANCPFQAFAKQRLNASTLEWPQPAIDARLRGTLLHTVLEQLWSSWNDYTFFKTLSTTERESQVGLAIDKSVIKHFSTETRKRHYQLLILEKERLKTLLDRWFDVEKNRFPFSVFSLEQKLQYELATLPFSLRIDRIDQTDDGQWVIIDYKTGQVDLKEWYGAIPAKPQLLLYALAFPQTVSALTFAQLRPDNVGFVGVDDATNAVLPALKPFNAPAFKTSATSWNEQMLLWRVQLENLAQDFQAGIVTVQPLQGAKTCANCYLPSLCRVNSRLATQGISDEAGF